MTSLPRKWTSASERLLLMMLACDAYGAESAASRDQLAAWAGLWHGDTSAALHALSEPTPERPALIVRQIGRGRGNRTKYLLRTDLDPSEVAGDSRQDSAAKKSPGNPGENPRTKSPGKVAGESRRGKSPGKVAGESPATPFPTLPTQHASDVPNAREGASPDDGQRPTAATPSATDAMQGATQRPRPELPDARTLDTDTADQLEAHRADQLAQLERWIA